MNEKQLDQAKVAQMQDRCRQLRLKCLKMAFAVGRNGSHLGAGLSSIEIFVALYSGILRRSRVEPRIRDRLIMSRGHSVLPYYAILQEEGFIRQSEIDLFEVNGSDLHGHATRDLQRGIEFSGGSLGMGATYSVGVALAGKLAASSFRVFTILGDGECDEGVVWESMMAASHLGLSNLTFIVDKNGLQYDGPPDEVMGLGDLVGKFMSFGFECLNVDGHDVGALYEAMCFQHKSKPTAIIAKTVKGKGVSFMENRREWHHAVLTRPQYEAAIAEIGNA